jgi:hypothetical protein
MSLVCSVTLPAAFSLDLGRRGTVLSLLRKGFALHRLLLLCRRSIVFLAGGASVTYAAEAIEPQLLAGASK